MMPVTGKCSTCDRKMRREVFPREWRCTTCSTTPRVVPDSPHDLPLMVAVTAAMLVGAFVVGAVLTHAFLRRFNL